jgi:hypothetical protein
MQPSLMLSARLSFAERSWTPSQASSFVTMRTWLLSLVCARLLRSWCVLWLAALLASLAPAWCPHEADSLARNVRSRFFFLFFSLHENLPFQKCTKYACERHWAKLTS